MSLKTPHELAEERMKMSEEFSAYSGILAKLKRKEAEYYVANRPTMNSDTAVKRAFSLTEDGIKLGEVKLKLAALKVQMSAHKTMLETLTEEARGLY